MRLQIMRKGRVFSMICYDILMCPKLVTGGNWPLSLQGILVEAGAATDYRLVTAGHKQPYLGLKEWPQKSKIWGCTPPELASNVYSSKTQNLLLHAPVAKNIPNTGILFSCQVSTLDFILSKQEDCGAVGRFWDPGAQEAQCATECTESKSRGWRRVRVEAGGRKTTEIKPIVRANLCLHTWNTCLHLQLFCF